MWSTRRQGRTSTASGSWRRQRTFVVWRSRSTCRCRRTNCPVDASQTERSISLHPSLVKVFTGWRFGTHLDRIDALVGKPPRSELVVQPRTDPLLLRRVRHPQMIRRRYVLRLDLGLLVRLASQRLHHPSQFERRARRLLFWLRSASSRRDGRVGRERRPVRGGRGGGAAFGVGRASAGDDAKGGGVGHARSGVGRGGFGEDMRGVGGQERLQSRVGLRRKDKRLLFSCMVAFAAV